MVDKKPANYVGGRAKDPTRLSTDPAQIRRRLRRGKNREEDIALYAEHSHYFKPVHDWDLEELAHGRPRGKNGGFQGRAPGWLTAEIVREARKRLVDHTSGLLGKHVEFAVRTMIKLIKSEEYDEKGRPIVDAKTKLQACMFIIEHVKGKPQQFMEVDATNFTRQMVAAAIILDDGSPQDEPVVLEGEFEEQEEEDDGTTD